MTAHILHLEGQMILFERMSAGLDRDHGVSVRKDLTVEEVTAFTGMWSEDVLDLCLRAGLTSVEVRRALRTGELPDKGIVDMLASLRNPEQP